MTRGCEDRSWPPTASTARVEWSLGGEAWSAGGIEGPNNNVLRVKATDTEGNTQPEEPLFNEHGYLHGGILAFPIKAVRA